MKINETEKLAKICYKLNESKSDALLPSTQKTYLKPFKKVLEKGFTIAKVTKI